MTEQYYIQENFIKETPGQAIENWQAQSTSLANVVPEIALLVNQAGEQLGILYEQAERVKNTDAMDKISTAWGNIQTMATRSVQLDAANKAAEPVINMLAKVADLYEGLQEAIWDQDTEHPELDQFAKAIQRNTEANMMVEAEAVATKVASELVYDDLMRNVMTLTGCEWEAVNRFVGVLMGDIPVSNLNAALLKEWIESLGK